MTEKSSLKRRGPILVFLDQIESVCEKRNPKLNEIISIFGSSGHFVLIFFLVIPFLQPIPLPGLSTPCGLIIALAALVRILGKPPWIPMRWQVKELPAQTVLKVAEFSEKIFEKMSWLMHPRLKIFFNPGVQILNMGLVILHGILLALPVPIPFSNAIPGWAILFMMIAQLEEDGAFVIAAYLQTICAFFYFYMLFVGADLGLKFLISSSSFDVL